MAWLNLLLRSNDALYYTVSEKIHSTLYYDVKSNPNGRWRKFEVDYFLSSDYCRLNVPSWMETPKNAIEQMDLPQLLEFTQQRLTTLQNAYEYLQQALGPKKE